MIYLTISFPLCQFVLEPLYLPTHQVHSFTLSISKQTKKLKHMNKKKTTKWNRKLIKRHEISFVLATYSWVWDLLCIVVNNPSALTMKKIEFSFLGWYQLQISSWLAMVFYVYFPFSGILSVLSLCLSHSHCEVTCISPLISGRLFPGSHPYISGSYNLPTLLHSTLSLKGICLIHIYHIPKFLKTVWFE